MKTNIYDEFPKKNPHRKYFLGELKNNKGNSKIPRKRLLMSLVYQRVVGNFYGACSTLITWHVLRLLFYLRYNQKKSFNRCFNNNNNNSKLWMENLTNIWFDVDFYDCNGMNSLLYKVNKLKLLLLNGGVKRLIWKTENM